jgi:Transcriptional regulatory protein, C terminal
MTSSSPPPINPFTRIKFWGRQTELDIIRSRLLSEPPQSIAIIGEPHIGKTTLVKHILSEYSTLLDHRQKEHKFAFVYLDCQSYIGLAEKEKYPSAEFWWKLYTGLERRLNVLGTKLQLDRQPSLQFDFDTENASIDTAFDIKNTLQGLIRDCEYQVVFVLDNFEGIARLPVYNSEWLRALASDKSAYIVTSRYLLYLLYQYNLDSWGHPSPFWNIFSDPIYLGLMTEAEVQDYLLRFRDQAEKLGSYWQQQDIEFIRKIAGRHPELLRIACSRLFDHRLSSDESLHRGYDEFDDEFLEESIYIDASVVCNQLWYGLDAPELRDEPTIPGYLVERDSQTPSQHQRILIDIANRRIPTDKKIIIVLERRGLIERVNGEWCIFADVMRQFVLEQKEFLTGEQIQTKNKEQGVATQTNAPIERQNDFTFTYLEGKVYSYLKANAGNVCDRENIKYAIWDNNELSNSALQKIIERIRDKLERDPTSTYELIAVRGRGYMLRKIA